MPEPEDLMTEWSRRGASISAFVTESVPADIVPVSVFDHGPMERGA